MKKITLILVAFILVISCKKDDDFTVESNNQSITNEEFALVNFGASITSNFFGHVVDKNGHNIKDVLITIGNESTYTDHNGIFTFNNATVYENFAFIKASKDGYIQASRALVPNSNSTNDVQITLLEKNIVSNISSGNPSELNLVNGSSITFGGDFIDSNGNPYNGEVNVSVHYLEPNQESTFTEMPGMLFGQRENGATSAMETYGMLAVNLYSLTGEELNIAETSPATLKFPISTSTPNAPVEIPLWYFDEEVGYWKEEGTATRIGNEYVAEVTHFTWWNCDIPIDDINMCFTLQYENTVGNSTHPIANNFFEIRRNTTGQLIYSGYTNDAGEECGIFPKNEEVTISIYGSTNGCQDQILHSQVYGPYNSDTSITVSVPNLSNTISVSQISGTVSNCTNNPITNGYMLLYKEDTLDFSEQTIIPISSGTIDYSFSYCGANTYNFIIFDLVTNQSTNVTSITLQPGITDLGTLNSCGNIIGGTYEGDVTLENQNAVNVFALLGYSQINGDLNIGKSSFTNDISDLSGLNSLNTIENLNIHHISATSLTGLNNLSILGDIYIYDCDGLITLDGLENITNFSGSIELRGNDSLTSTSGLDNITSLGGNLNFIGNDNLTSITNLTNLTTIHGSLNFIGTYITSFSGLDNLTSVGDEFILFGAHNISSFSGLNNLTSVGGIASFNSDITTLDGLENLISCGDLSFSQNSTLTDFCALSNLFINGTYGTLYNTFNANNPSVTDIQSGNCN